MAACQNGAGAKKGRKKLYECQVQFVLNQGHQVLTEGIRKVVQWGSTETHVSFQSKSPGTYCCIVICCITLLPILLCYDHDLFFCSPPSSGLQ